MKIKARVWNEAALSASFMLLFFTLPNEKCGSDFRKELGVKTLFKHG